MNIKTHLSKLGLKGKDKITGVEGVIDSISFDLYGCIQVILNMGFSNDEGKFVPNTRWFDISRIEITNKKPVMPVPNYDYGEIAKGKKGPAEKPL